MDIGSIAKFIDSGLDQLQCLDWSGYMNNPIGIISFVIPTFLAIFWDQFLLWHSINSQVIRNKP